MSDLENVSSLMLEQFRRLNGRFDKVELQLMELRERVTAVEEHLGGLVISVGSINGRIDRVENRLDRIERRLDLVNV